MHKTPLPKRNWGGMTTWVPTHAPNLRAIRSRSATNYSRAMHADHPWDVTLTSRLFPSGSLMVVRTTVSPTPHARTPRDLGFPLLITGMWLGNHLFQLIFTVLVTDVQGLLALHPVAEHTSDNLVHELRETLAHASLWDPIFGGPPWLWSTPKSEDWAVQSLI